MKIKSFSIYSLVLSFTLLVIGSHVSKASPTKRLLVSTIHVAPSGSDSDLCGLATEPCKTIQRAVNIAVEGDIILVAKGTYTGSNPCPTSTNASVVCIQNKHLTILGGYTTNNWSVANPTQNVTIIDGQNSQRGMYLWNTVMGTASLHLEGFTIQNGRQQGIASSDDNKSFAFGGGMLVDRSDVTLKHIIFQNNQAVGANTNSAHGGAGSGGGLAIRAVNNAYLEHIYFTENKAQGGMGLERGGFGIGGGLYTYESSVVGQYITSTNNLAIAGSSNGDGRSGGELADAQGAGVAFQISSDITLSDIIITNNTATGGDAPNGDAGGAFGAGLFTEEASLSVHNLIVQDNMSIGGMGKNSATNASLAFGGGIVLSHSSSTINRAFVIHNTAQGGDGNIYAGSGGGGGVYIERFYGTATTELTNVIIADNTANMGSGNPLAGGGGGGLILNSAEATLTHVTIAQNRLGSSAMQGNGMVLISGAQAEISHSIIANHTDYAGAIAIHAQSGNTVTFNNNLLFGNNIDTGGGGIINGTDSNFSGSPDFVSAGAPNYDYHINNNSMAIGQATGSTTAVDIDNESRSISGLPDVGADEFVALVLSASPLDGQLRLNWTAEVALLPGLDHYQIQVIPASGANDPAEGTSIDAGTQTSFMLTGLTNYKNYTITIDAQTGAGSTIAQSNTVNVFPTDMHVYLPIILK